MRVTGYLDIKLNVECGKCGIHYDALKLKNNQDVLFPILHTRLNRDIKTTVGCPHCGHVVEVGDWKFADSVAPNLEHTV